MANYATGCSSKGSIRKNPCKETKIVVASVKNDATKHICEELDTMEGQAKIYKISKKTGKENGGVV